MGIVAGILDILAAILAIMVVKEIDKQQTESAKLIPREALSGQPPPPPTLEPAEKNPTPSASRHISPETHKTERA